MKFYLSNVLKGFKSTDAHIELKTKMRQTPNFVIVDIDQDDMPEILFTYIYTGEKYIGVLKRKDMQWYFVQTMPEREQKAIGLGNLVNTVEETVIRPNDIGKIITMETLFNNRSQAFVSFIDDRVTHGEVLQTNEALPQSQDINTPEAQQALDQNIETPIMSVKEINPVVNGVIGGQNGDLDKEVINFTQADVTGDGNLDSIYLVGDRRDGDPTRYIRNMGLRVKTGGRTLKVDFPYGNGYSPVLFVGDLTSDGILDVLVNIFSSGTGGFMTSYIYSFVNEEPRMLFDSKMFNELYTGKVIFQDNYTVRVTTDRPPWQYTIDLSDRDPGYLSSLYEEDGSLIRPREGTLLGLTALNPVDYDVNGEFNISSIQRVIGTGNLDTLGLVETYLSWRGATNRFEPFMQYLSILGRPL